MLTIDLPIEVEQQIQQQALESGSTTNDYLREMVLKFFAKDKPVEQTTLQKSIDKLPSRLQATIDNKLIQEFEQAKMLVDGEFSQRCIESSDPEFNQRIIKVATGQSTTQQMINELMGQWNQLNERAV